MQLGFDKDWLTWLVDHPRVWEGVKGSFCCWRLGIQGSSLGVGIRGVVVLGVVVLGVVVLVASPPVGSAAAGGCRVGGLFFFSRCVVSKARLRASSSGHSRQRLCPLRVSRRPL